LAYFQYDGVHFSFTHFSGNKKSFLYSFYLAAFRLPLIYIDGLNLTDSLPVNKTFKGWRLFIHDFTAPFFLYLNVIFEVKMRRIGSEFDPEYIEFDSTLSGYSFNHLVWNKGFKLVVNRDNSLIFENKNLEIKAICDVY
jgi:hypothetical protein